MEYFILLWTHTLEVKSLTSKVPSLGVNSGIPINGVLDV